MFEVESQNPNFEGRHKDSLETEEACIPMRENEGTLN